MSELRLILLPNECARGSQQGNEWASSARTQSQRSERFTVGSGEAAHLFRRLRARTLKMLSVKRGRAGRLDVQFPPSSSTLDLHAVGPLPAHSHVHYVERVQVAVPTSGEHALEVWEAIGAKALWRARGEWCEPPSLAAGAGGKVGYRYRRVNIAATRLGGGYF